MSSFAAGPAAVFKGLSALRGKRVFHPFGVGLRGSLLPVGQPTGAPALDRSAPVVARLSRALGLPEAIPDLFGLALRIPDAHGPGRHQDLLLVSSGGARIARHLLLPARGLFDRPYSSILPYRLNGELVVVGARALAAEGPGPDLDALTRGEPAALEFELAVAEPLGHWRPAARVLLDQRMTAAETERLAIDPTNTGGGLELAGWLNRLRGPSYRASQEGRGLWSVPLAPGKPSEGDQPDQRDDQTEPEAPDDHHDDPDDDQDPAER